MLLSVHGSSILNSNILFEGLNFGCFVSICIAYVDEDAFSICCFCLFACNILISSVLSSLGHRI